MMQMLWIWFMDLVHSIYTYVYIYIYIYLFMCEYNVYKYIIIIIIIIITIIIIFHKTNNIIFRCVWRWGISWL
jgi:hypothetical protein